MSARILLSYLHTLQCMYSLSATISAQVIMLVLINLKSLIERIVNMDLYFNNLK